MYSITTIIIVLTSIISFLAFNNARLMNALIFWPPAVSMRHQYYRFVTCGFIHADIMHLAFNMFTLYFFGKALELYYMGDLGLEPYYYVILYFAALIVANIPSYLKHRDDYAYRSLGASGAVCAVLFAFILLRPWAPILLFVIKMPVTNYKYRIKSC